MEKITTIIDLKNSIQQLENSRAIDWLILKEQFLVTAEALKPGHILGDIVKNILATPELKKNVVNTVFGMTTGIAAAKLFIGKSSNPLAKLAAGAIIGIATSAGVSKAAGGIKAVGFNLLKKIFPRGALKERNGTLH